MVSRRNGGAQRFTVRIDDQIAALLAEYCGRTGLERSDAVRTLLAWSLARSKGPKAQAAIAIQSEIIAHVTRRVAEMQKAIKEHLTALVGT